ncbi:MAG: amidase [bacterium]
MPEEIRDETLDLDGVAQAALVRRGEVTPRELVETAIGRLERLNPKLGAVIHPTFERARAEAKAGPVDGVFAGIPFLLKDASGEQEGELYTQGMSALRQIGARAREDSAMAIFARRAGLISIGRTNTPEMALLPTTEPDAFGPSRNPWNPAYSSGGSSGGAAAAVAAGIVAIAHGSDGGGSIRGPAAKCGLVGLKPTRGRTSFGPARGEHWSSLSTNLVLTRTVRDTAAALDAFALPFAGDPYSAPPAPGLWVEAARREPGRLRIGFMARAPRETPVHPDVARGLESMVETLESLGHEVEPIHPELLEDLEPTLTYVRIIAANIARGLDRTAGLVGRPLAAEDVEPLTWALAERGRALSAAEHLADLEFIHRFGREMAWLQEAQRLDLLLTPTQALPPARLGEISSTADEPFRAFARAAPYGVFTLPFNLSGQPAISLPAGFTTGEDEGWPAGLPVGAQLVAPRGREDLLLQLAHQLEQDRRWGDPKPPVSVWSS